MITPNAWYRADPSRGVYISGVINGELLSRITPRILSLQHASRDPITVYIDSPGGSVFHMETILGMLKLSDQNSAEPCRITTVVANQAGSAAADLLSSGDYALAYPTSAILYHGTRLQESQPLTLELTSTLGSWLRSRNTRYAMELARKIEERFTFRFVVASPQFKEVRAANPGKTMSDLECFLAFIDSRLSPEAKKVWKRARERHLRYGRLFSAILTQVRGDIDKMSRAKLEGASIKALVNFEVRMNKKDPSWSFTNGGIESLADDFFLLNEYLSTAGDGRLHKWASTFGRYLLSSEEIAAIDAIQNDAEKAERLVEKVTPILEPVWSFFVALCHALQSGENELTAWDAYWLGLIDEVVGDRSLISLRTFAEYTPDPPQPVQQTLPATDPPPQPTDNAPTN